MQARAHSPNWAASGGRSHKPGCTALTQNGLGIVHSKHLATMKIFRHQRKVQGTEFHRAMS